MAEAAQRRLIEPRVPVAERHVTVWSLALSGGFVVAAAFTMFAHAEVGPMTGNVIATSTTVARHGLSSTFTRAVPIPAFIGGIAVGVLLDEEYTRRHRRRALATTLGLEALLLGAFMAWAATVLHGSVVRVSSHWELDGLIALPAFALGLQTAAVRRVEGQTTRTAYLSGMLTRFTEEAIRLLYWRRDRRGGATEPPWRNTPRVRRLALIGGTVVAYGGGVLLGAWSFNGRLRAWSLALPIAALVTIAIADAAQAASS
jgi:uncharacterized membrane protein YoaK (UPF0700 family)